MTSSFIEIPVGTSAQSLQRAINSAQAGDVFRLAAGVHRFTQTIEIYQHGVSLIGAGRDKTTIVMDNDDIDAPVIQVGHRLHNPVVQSTVGLAEFAHRGETQLTLSSAAWLNPGDVIFISQDNTDAFLDEIGDTLWREDRDLRTLMAEIVAVNGNVVTLDTPLTFDFDPQLTTVEDHWVVDDVTLSGFTVEGPYGPANPESYKNTKDGQHHSMIVAAGTRDLSVNAISIKDSISHALTVANSVDANISNIVIDGAHNKGTQGNGYGLWIRDVYDSRFTELDIVDVRHAVLFASWTSASGNYVHVSDTNRDINFHGGRDQFNTVVVDVMRVNDASSNAPGKEVFFNEGEVYGAPTDASVNEVLIRSSVAQVYEHHEVETDGRVRWRGDEIFTGAGDDYAAGGSGADTIYASDGDDAIDGGAGFDVLVLPGLRADYLVTKDDDALYFDRSNDTTWAHQVESFRFRDMTLSASDLRATALLENKTVDNPDTAVEGAGEIGPEDPTGGTDGGTGGGVFDVNGLIPATHLGWESMDVSVLDKVSGSERWERIWIDTSSKIDGTVEAVSMAGSAHLVVVGNSGDNQMAGNHGDNRLEGRNGDDKIFGKNGNDTLLGGKGDDDLDGGTENDQLDGGLGDDTIEGGGGDDTIRASAGEDWVDGENGEADLIIFSKTTRDFTVRMEDDDVYQFTEGANTTYIEAVEMFAFTNGTFSLDEIDAWIATGVSPDQDPNNPDPPLPDFDFDLVSPL